MGLKLKGKIVEWNPSKGFGFIRSNVDSRGIFIHISDFKNRQYKPKLGDIIAYEVSNGENNKKKAINAICEGDFTSNNKYKKKSRMEKKFYILLIVLPLFFLSLNREDTNDIDSNSLGNHIEVTNNTNNNNDEDVYSDELVTKNIMENEVKKEIRDDIPLVPKGIAELYNKHIRINKKASSKYTCDGRQHCSQMNSCEEAKFFINNCPNTKMDGDRDGVPCERQWCSY